MGVDVYVYVYVYAITTGVSGFFAGLALGNAVFGRLAWVLPFILVALPATLMGGTLPPLFAAVRPEDDAVGKASGQLYAANTAGAITGALPVTAVYPV